jgi:DNA polymerase-1
MTGKEPEDVTPEERQAAKAVNFGACYGQGASGLRKAVWDNYGTILTLEEAQWQVDAFKATFLWFARWRGDHAYDCEARNRILIGRDAAKGQGREFPRSSYLRV